MNNVQAHYESLLAENYTWMLGGDIERAAHGQRVLLEDLAITPLSSLDSVAVDLGCGSGAQTLALGDIGFAAVLAVDSNAALLTELAGYARSRPGVRTRHGDLLEVLADLPVDSVEAVVCMGDTVLHLPDPDAVDRLLRGAASALRRGGALVLSYRDLTNALHGVDRFIPVRSTPERIMFCFLDYQDDDTVAVHDIVYTRGPDGWLLAKSSYPKLRLAPAWLARQVEAAGLRVERHEVGPSGMWITLARREPANSG